MATLNLPRPVNSYAGEDELRSKLNGFSNGNGHANGEDGMDEDDAGLGGQYRVPKASDKYKKGIIYPPKEIRGEPYLCEIKAALLTCTAIIDKTAGHICKSPNPIMLEEKIREHQKTDPKFAFLNDADPFHQYYRYSIERIREEAEDAAKGIAPPPPPESKVQQQKVEVSNGYEPKLWEFKVDMPGVTAMDL